MTSIASATPRLSLFACLPDELIETIGRDVYGDPEEWSLEGLDALRCLAQVDRRTRRILQQLCWKTLYVTTDAKDFSKLVELLDAHGPFVESLVCEISPTAIKNETQMQDLAIRSRFAGNCETSAFGTTTATTSASRRTAFRMRSLTCGGSAARLADYAPALAVLLPHTARLQSISLSIYGSLEHQPTLRVFIDALMRRSSLQILLLSEPILLHAQQINLPHLQHLGLDFDDYEEDEDLSALVTSILQSASSHLRHIGARLPNGAIHEPHTAPSITFPRLESLRLCGRQAPLFMFTIIKVAPSLESLSLCRLDATILDRLHANYAKQPVKALREVVVNRGPYAHRTPETDGSFLRLKAWATSNGIRVLIEDEEAWIAGELAKSQRRAGLRPRYI
ncbi:hypothetical protein BMF94_1986 [Rhodotorula taiwanensis]|uniref:F-box domain-containing protein n=1 Tax=Rhodotorula taiwanensis TaxID=741276 RepID=A0A2S5BE14_9BASI|nr:hypothetical protein BMF94_1986 [Rhodotorula taiwanensis]